MKETKNQAERIETCGGLGLRTALGVALPAFAGLHRG